MASVIAIANQKGGVGKTTSVVNLAAFCALAGRRTLVVDNDPQGNASSVLAPDYDGPSVYGGGRPQPTSLEHLDILPAGNDLGAQQNSLVMREDGDSALAVKLIPLRDEYDCCFIDCPPSLATLPVNALVAADRVLVPIQCEYYAMEGLGQILAHIEELLERGSSELNRIDILLTMFDAELPFANQVANEVAQHFPDQLLRTRIPRDIALAAAPSHSRTILEHDPLSPGAIAYLAAAKELLDGLE